MRSGGFLLVHPTVAFWSQADCHVLLMYRSAALNYSMVAAGQLDLYWEIGCWSWDVCAGTIIAREAGGKVYGAFIPSGAHHCFFRLIVSRSLRRQRRQALATSRPYGSPFLCRSCDCGHAGRRDGRASAAPDREGVLPGRRGVGRLEWTSERHRELEVRSPKQGRCLSSPRRRRARQPSPTLASRCHSASASLALFLLSPSSLRAKFGWPQHR